jgi:hypothetical protein
MKQITTLTAAPKQQHTLVLENNDTADFYLEYCPRMQSWYFNISYGDITQKCIKVVLTPNALRHLRRVIPFGIAFMSDSLVEPFGQEDFKNGRVQIYVLNEEDVAEIESEIYNEEL